MKYTGPELTEAQAKAVYELVAQAQDEARTTNLSPDGNIQLNFEPDCSVIEITAQARSGIMALQENAGVPKGVYKFRASRNRTGPDTDPDILLLPVPENDGRYLTYVRIDIAPVKLAPGNKRKQHTL